MNGLKTLAIIVAVIIAFVFAALAVNQQEISLTFAIWQTPFALSLFWWLLAAFLTGLFFGLLNAAWINLKHRLTNRHLRRSLEQANSELERLRGLSVQG